MDKDPKLHNIPRHNIFQVPEQYFDKLPTRIMARTAAADDAHPATAWQRPLRLVLAPLLLLLLFVGVYFFNVPTKPEPMPAGFSALAQEEIVNYLTENAAQLETSDLSELTFLSDKKLTAEFLNVSPKAAEKELEYYPISEQDY
ncbi:hypothetical protein [Pontibacter chitinilyticus]|uniref:hypothetical protein n=1 Tax=Pontibacter chitinilyticus TaxID=2674989 RepID=UPI00321A3116